MGKTAKDRRINSVLSVVLTIVCILWMYPVFMILMNSLKTERAITTTHAFELPTVETFVGLKNYIYGITEMDFLSSLWYSFIITISSVALILLCCSMCAWYITRVQGVLSKGMYYLCVFSMIVPFQMVMFTLAKTADTPTTSASSIWALAPVWRCSCSPALSSRCPSPLRKPP